jgi:hypothetical protein
MIFLLLIEHHVVSKVLSILSTSLDFFFSFSIDFHATEWQVNNETGKRERLCTYKVTVTAVIGSTTICSNERQVKNKNFFRIFFFLNKLFNK